MSEEKYNTNLAAEFYVLSMLHRLGASAALTLGNKKSVDFAVVTGVGKAITIDVKGLAGTTSWPVDRVRSKSPNHFLAFVCFNNRIRDPTAAPDVWIVPVARVKHFTYISPKERRVVTRSKLLKRGNQFKDAWELIL
jgi:hypothetical protein